MGDFEEWKEGGRAFYEGKPYTANPYVEGSNAYLDWKSGWVEAEDGMKLEWFK